MAENQDFSTSVSAPQPVKHMGQVDLARRWRVSPRTLERWRCVGQGPSYLKIGGRVVYRIEDVEAYESRRVRTSTANVSQVSPAARRS